MSLVHLGATPNITDEGVKTNQVRIDTISQGTALITTAA